MIRVANLAKRYKKAVAASDVSLEAPDGAITTLLGANGSGKSTTFRAIYGVLKPDSGLVEIDGVDVATRTVEARKRLGACPDDFGLFPKLTAKEHVQFYGRLYGLEGASLEKAVDRASDMMTLGELSDRRVEGFSLGERMKTAIASTLVHQPKNLVMDEPMRGLDVVNVRQLRAVFRDLRDAGVCLLMSSHVLPEVSQLSDHIVVIANGVTCAAGAPAEIARHGDGDLEEAFIRLSQQAEAA